MNEDYLDGRYIRGYTQALVDVEEVIGYITNDVKMHKRTLNKDVFIEIIRQMIEHRVEIREQRDGFLRCEGMGKDMKIAWHPGKKEELDNKGKIIYGHAVLEKIPIMDENGNVHYELHLLETMATPDDPYYRYDRKDSNEQADVYSYWKDNGNGTVSCEYCNTWFPKERMKYMRYCGYCGAVMGNCDAWINDRHAYNTREMEYEYRKCGNHRCVNNDV